MASFDLTAYPYSVTLRVDAKDPSDAASIEQALREIGVNAANPRATADALHVVSTPQDCTFETRTDARNGALSVHVSVIFGEEPHADILLSGLLLARDLGRDVLMSEVYEYDTFSTRGCGTTEHRSTWVSATPTEHQGCNLQEMWDALVSTAPIEQQDDVQELPREPQESIDTTGVPF